MRLPIIDPIPGQRRGLGRDIQVLKQSKTGLKQLIRFIVIIQLLNHLQVFKLIISIFLRKNDSKTWLQLRFSVKIITTSKFP